MVNISKVYRKDDGETKGWAFIMTVSDKNKGYLFETKRDANRGRAKLIKTIKEANEDIKVYC